MGGNTYLLWLHHRCIEDNFGGSADLHEIFFSKRNETDRNRNGNSMSTLQNPGIDQRTGILVLIITINTFILY